MELEVKEYGRSAMGATLGQNVPVDLSAIAGTVHFVGIGGIGMSAIARLLLGQGAAVSGSDKAANSVTDELAKLGARISIGHRVENIDGAAAIVVSTAISCDNPELVAARSQGLPVWHRSQLLASVSRQSRLIAVSGTHGKTTTTAMVAQILLDCGLDPSIVIGGLFSRIGSNALLGSGEYFVAEADESDGTHAQAQSYMALITNIEADHLENYPGGLEQIRDDMVSFANHSTRAVILCQDDPGCRLIRPRISCPVITYGLAATAAQADYTYESLPGFGLRLLKSGVSLGEVELQVPGEHNKLNALAAAVVGVELGLELAAVRKALSAFGGVARRFQIVGQEQGITVIDDYAHHPTEVTATIQAAAEYRRQGNLKADASAPGSRIVAVFQPHQPGRLRDLWEEFCSCFAQADLVLVTDIYIARGQPIAGVTSEILAGSVKHDNVRYLSGPISSLPAQIIKHLQPGDLILTIGAGDITRVGPEILNLLRQRSSHGRDI